jgi:hypothetical protein
MLNINNNLVSSFYTRNNKHVKKHIVRTLRRSPLTIYINMLNECVRLLIAIKGTRCPPTSVQVDDLVEATLLLHNITKVMLPVLR